jgi:hypothetical protein
MSPLRPCVPIAMVKAGGDRMKVNIKYCHA